MLPIAGKTAGPNRRKLFVVTQGWPGVSKVVFSSFSTFFFTFFSPATPGPSVSIEYNDNNIEEIFLVLTLWL